MRETVYSTAIRQGRGRSDTQHRTGHTVQVPLVIRLKLMLMLMLKLQESDAVKHIVYNDIITGTVCAPSQLSPLSCLCNTEVLYIIYRIKTFPVFHPLDCTSIVTTT